MLYIQHCYLDHISLDHVSLINGVNENKLARAWTDTHEQAVKWAVIIILYIPVNEKKLQDVYVRKLTDWKIELGDHTGWKHIAKKNEAGNWYAEASEEQGNAYHLLGQNP